MALVIVAIRTEKSVKEVWLSKKRRQMIRLDTDLHVSESSLEKKLSVNSKIITNWRTFGAPPKCKEDEPLQPIKIFHFKTQIFIRARIVYDLFYNYH